MASIGTGMRTIWGENYMMLFQTILEGLGLQLKRKLSRLINKEKGKAKNKI